MSSSSDGKTRTFDHSMFFLDFGQKTGKPHTDPDWSITLPLFVSLTSPFSVHGGALPTFRKQISPNLSSSNWSSHYPRHAIHSPENMKLFMLFHFSGGSIFGLMSWWERQEVKNEEHHLHFSLWYFFAVHNSSVFRNIYKWIFEMKDGFVTQVYT